MMTRYYKNFLNELIMRLLTGIALTIGVSSLVIVYNGNKEIEALEGQHLIYFSTLVQEARISAKDELKEYINSLPLPEDTNEEMYNEDTHSEDTHSEEMHNEETYDEETNEEEANDEKTYNEDDVMLLAKLMHAEEGVLRYKLSPDEAKLAHMLCGSVVINRRNMNYMGAKTIKEVIYTPGQYASIDSLNQNVPEETIEWARELIENGPIGPSNMIYQAQFEQGEAVYEHIGNQYFCTK